MCPFPCLYCVANLINQPICTKCYPGFYLVSQNSQNNSSYQCLYCNMTNCLNCFSSTFCTICSEGYFTVLSPIDGSQTCQLCPSSCSQCQATNNSQTASFQCTLCSSGYYLDQSGCNPCNINNCIYCPVQKSLSYESPICLECSTGYVLKANNSYNFNMPPYICQPCSIQNCKVCNLNYWQINGQWMISDPFCINCGDGFYLQSQTICSQCSANCLKCSNSNFCLVCQANFFTALQSNGHQLCQPCPAQCLYCNSDGCLTCGTGYYHEFSAVIQTNSVYQCLSCNVLQGCQQCLNENWCTLCFINGYAMLPDTYGQCIACGQGCVTCDQDVTCSQCEVGYQLITQINQCQQISGVPVWGIFSVSFLGFIIAFVILEKLTRVIHQYMSNKKKNNKISQIQCQDNQSSQIQCQDTIRSSPQIEVQSESLEQKSKQKKIGLKFDK